MTNRTVEEIAEDVAEQFMRAVDGCYGSYAPPWWSG